MMIEATTQAHQVFLSYSRTDRESSIALRHALEQAGVSVFRDEDRIRIGERWQTRLQHELKTCSAFVLLVGRDGVQRWVGAEVEIALSRHFSPHDDNLRLAIFPILLEGAKPDALPPFLNQFQSAHWLPNQPLPYGLLEAIRTQTSRFVVAEPFEGCPFMGLSAFGRGDAQLFFGRRNEALEALRCLGDQRESNPEQMPIGDSGYCRWLQIEGNSGAGKSSLVHAGLLPMIALGALWARTGFDHWTLLEPMMPGLDPVAKLAEILEWGLKPDETQRDSLALQQRLEQDERALARRVRDALPSKLSPPSNGGRLGGNAVELIPPPNGGRLGGGREKSGRQPLAADGSHESRHGDSDLQPVSVYIKAKAKPACLLIIDQFEELFTFADETQRKHFDALLAHALADPECPLFVISTVRADFLDRMERLPRLQAIYNSHCKRFFLPVISAQGLREVIEQPARLAGLDVSEVTAAIIDDARDEIGALPLVENALFTLWQNQKPNSNRLSGQWYSEHGGIAGILSAQADKLLDRIDSAIPKGKRAALELLLRLTRINDEGRHTRQRITREEAVDIAGEAHPDRGERVIRLLSGERPADMPSTAHTGALRLIVISTEKTAETELSVQFVDLIHETLIRARGKDEKSGKRVGYWPTLFDYIEANRDRDLHRQQLILQTNQWQQSKGLGRWWHLAGFGDLKRFQKLRVRQHSAEGRFLCWSRRAAWASTLVLLSVLGVFGESAWWASRNNLPFAYAFIKPLWALGLYQPLPEMVTIPAGNFTMGCVKGRDDVEQKCNDDEFPAHEVTITKPFMMGKHEVTFLQYDYSVWDRQRHGDNKIFYPADESWGRLDRPVIHVSWKDAKAYSHWLSDKTRENYRLPTEAEWEYAARADTDTAFGWGQTLGIDNANCGGGSSRWGGKSTAPVGSFPANPWGLYDTAGNVWEWVEDEYHASYTDAPGDGSAWEAVLGGSKVLRGGSWDYDARCCRSACRLNYQPDDRDYVIGFRCARVQVVSQ